MWFPAKKYGWGWGPPCAWQGWLVYVVWLGLLCAGAAVLAPHSVGLFVGYAFVLGGLLFAVVLLKGEKPGWRWGEDKDSRSRSSTERLAELEDLHQKRLISDAEYRAKRQQILRDV